MTLDREARLQEKLEQVRSGPKKVGVPCQYVEAILKTGHKIGRLVRPEEVAPLTQALSRGEDLPSVFTLRDVHGEVSLFHGSHVASLTIEPKVMTVFVPEEQV